MKSNTTKLSIALLALAMLALFGCGGTREIAQDAAPLLRIHPSERPLLPTGMNLKTPARSAPEIPADAQNALSSFGAPQLTAATRGDKDVSVALPYNFPAEQQYAAPGDAGYILSKNTQIPGALGGADMLPLGATYPDNLAYVVYRVDDISQDLGYLQLSFGLVLPGSQVGVAVYNWAYGANGYWEPLFYGDPTAGVNIQLFGFPGEDFTNANDDLAFMVFCVNPASVNLSTVNIEPQPVNPGFDEVEPDNNDASTANVLPAFNFAGFTGNVGEGGVYDGGTFDVFAFSAAVGDTVTFTVTYDPIADSQDQDGDPNTFDSGMGLILFDQLAWDTQFASGVAWASGGTGGIAQLPYTLDGTESGQLYIAVVDGYFQTPVPATNYTLSGSNSAIGGNYDEVEPNNSDAEANPITFPLADFTGNIGEGGVYDGILYDDWYGFSANVGDTFDFQLTYDPAADWDVANNVGLVMGIVDQVYIDTQDPAHVWVGYGGQDPDFQPGLAHVTHTFDGSEVAPFYFIVENYNPAGSGKPPTDYTLNATQQ